MEKPDLIFRREPIEIFILLLSVISLFNGAVLLIWPDETWTTVIRNIDLLICFILVADFLSLLYLADYRIRYLVRGWGWADLLGSLPVPGFRLFRLLRMGGVAGQLRSEGIYGMRRGFRGRLSECTLLFVALGLILLLETGCILVLNAEEEAAGANILTGGDALWWAAVTVATVGYGDLFPVTTNGRIIGALIMTASVGLVAVSTAYVANSFLNRQPREQGDGDATADSLRAELTKLQISVQQLQESVDKLLDEKS